MLLLMVALSGGYFTRVHRMFDWSDVAHLSRSRGTFVVRNTWSTGLNLPIRREVKGVVRATSLAAKDTQAILSVGLGGGIHIFPMKDGKVTRMLWASATTTREKTNDLRDMLQWYNATYNEELQPDRCVIMRDLLMWTAACHSTLEQ